MRGLLVAGMGAVSLMIGCQTPDWQRGRGTIKPPLAQCTPAKKSPCPAMSSRTDSSRTACIPGRKTALDRKDVRPAETGDRCSKTRRPSSECRVVRPHSADYVPEPAGQECAPKTPQPRACLSADSCRGAVQPERLSPRRAKPRSPHFPPPPNAVQVPRLHERSSAGVRPVTRVLALHWSQIQVPIPRFVSIPTKVLEQHAEGVSGFDRGPEEAEHGSFSVEADVADRQTQPRRTDPSLFAHAAEQTRLAGPVPPAELPATSFTVSVGQDQPAPVGSAPAGWNAKQTLASARSPSKRAPATRGGQGSHGPVPTTGFGHTIAPAPTVPALPASPGIRDDSGIELWPYSPAARAARSAW